MPYNSISISLYVECPCIGCELLFWIACEKCYGYSHSISLLEQLAECNMNSLDLSEVGTMNFLDLCHCQAPPLSCFLQLLVACSRLTWGSWKRLEEQMMIVAVERLKLKRREGELKKAKARDPWKRELTGASKSHVFLMNSVEKFSKLVFTQ